MPGGRSVDRLDIPFRRPLGRIGDADVPGGEQVDKVLDVDRKQLAAVSRELSFNRLLGENRGSSPLGSASKINVFAQSGGPRPPFDNLLKMPAGRAN